MNAYLDLVTELSSLAHPRKTQDKGVCTNTATNICVYDYIRRLKYLFLDLS